MAEELINQIISPDAFAQVEKLQKQLKETLDDFTKAAKGAKAFDAVLRGAKGLHALEKAIREGANAQELLAKAGERVVATTKKVAQAQKVADDSLAAFNQRIKQLTNEYNALGNSEEKHLRRKEAIRREILQLTAAYSGEKKALSDAKKGIDAAEKSYYELSKITQDLQRQLKSMPGAFDKTTGAINKHNKEAVIMAKQIRTNNELLKKYDAQLGQHFRNVGNYTQAATGLKNYFTFLTGFFGAGFVAAAATREIVRSNVEISDSLTEVQRVAGLTTDETNNLYNSIKSIGTRTTLSGLLDLSRIGAQLGIAKDDLAGFTEALNELSVTLGKEIQGGPEGIATALGKINQLLGIGSEYGVAEGLKKTGSAILALGQHTLATGGYLSDFAERVGGVAKIANISLPTILAYGAVLEANGVTAELAGTNFQRLIVQLGRVPEKFYDIAKAADPSVSLEEFIGFVNNDAAKALDLFFRGMQKTSSSFTEFAKASKETGLPGQRVAQILSAIASSLDEVSDNMGVANEAFRTASEIEEQYNLVNDNLAGSIKQLRNEITKLVTDPSSDLAGFFMSIVQAATAVTRAIANGHLFSSLFNKFDQLPNDFTTGVAQQRTKNSNLAQIALSNDPKKELNNYETFLKQQLNIYSDYLDKFNEAKEKAGRKFNKNLSGMSDSELSNFIDKTSIYDNSTQLQNLQKAFVNYSYLKKNVQSLIETESKYLPERTKQIEEFKKLFSEGGANKGTFTIYSPGGAKSLRDRISASEVLKDNWRTIADIQKEISGIDKQLKTAPDQKAIDSLLSRKKELQGIIKERLKLSDSTKKEVKTSTTLYNKQIALNKQLRKAEADNAQKEAQSAFEIQQTKLQQSINANETIVKDDRKSLDDRLDALKEFLEQQKRLIESNKQQQIHALEANAEQQALEFKQRQALINAQKKNKGKALTDKQASAVIAGVYLTPGEIDAAAETVANQRREIIVKANEELAQLLQNTGQQAANLVISAPVVANSDNQFNDIDKNRNSRLMSNNSALSEGLISQKEYEDKQTEIIFQAEQDRLMIQLTNAKKRYDTAIQTGEGIAEASINFSEKLMAISDHETGHYIENEEKKKEATLKTLNDIQQYGGQFLQVLSDASQISAEKQKNELQDQIDNINEATQAEIDAVNRSLLSHEEKADKIAIINARSQAQTEELARRQRKLDEEKARFDKAQSIFNIILNTAEGVTKALASANIPLSIIIGAMGAAELAIAAATPIPQYAKGRDGGPAEWAIVGEQGPEIIETPDGRQMLTPDGPTITYLPEHAIVKPHNETILELAKQNALKTMLNTPFVNEGEFNRQYIEVMEREIRSLKQAVNNIPNRMPINNTNFSWSERGVRKWVQKGNSYTEWINNLKH